jgi:AcrR family transcriptional regulator
LLQAAGALFRSKGFAATTTRDIAAAVGMQSGSPFYHFKSKDALLFAVMEEGMTSALARQQTTLERTQDETPLAQLRGLVHTHFLVLLGAQSDFIPVMLYESRSLTPAQRDMLSALQSQYENLWVPVLKSLHASGHLRAPVVLARLLILGALNWSVQWFDPHKKASVDDLSDAAMALFVGGSVASS